MKKLTSAEEEVMQILWTKERAFVKDIVLEMPEPKPAYNTVSTIVRILENKGFVGHKAYGKSHEYYPLINKREYRNFLMKAIVPNYFENSFGSLLSYFMKDEELNDKQIEELEDLIKELKNK